MVINRATIQNWMFLLSLREIRYLRSGRNLNGTKSSQNLMYVVHEVTLSYRWRADTRPQPSWSWMRSCYSNVTSFPITADKSNYVVGSMTVTNQSSNHLPDLFLCSQITPRLIKQNNYWEIKPTPWSDWIFGNLLECFLVYKICNQLYPLIGLQRNTPYSKSNQRATRFLRQ